MTNLKKIITVGTMVLAIGATSITAFAASSYKNNAEVAAALTGRTVDSVTAERKDSGNTYGTIAKEAGKLEEFKKESLEMKKDNLKAQVAAGKMTQEKADAIIKALEENQANCDGTGTAKIGQKMGAKFGSNGQGQGTGGQNKGQGMGRGQGQGQGQRNGSGHVTN